MTLILYTLGVITAFSEARSSHEKIDVAFFSWFLLIVESGNILCLRRPLRANSSIVEVKKERVEAFTQESFYLLLLFFNLLSFLSLLHREQETKLKPHWALQLRRVPSR